MAGHLLVSTVLCTVMVFAMAKHTGNGREAHNTNGEIPSKPKDIKLPIAVPIPSPSEQQEFKSNLAKLVRVDAENRASVCRAISLPAGESITFSSQDKKKKQKYTCKSTFSTVEGETLSISCKIQRIICNFGQMQIVGQKRVCDKPSYEFTSTGNKFVLKVIRKRKKKPVFLYKCTVTASMTVKPEPECHKCGYTARPTARVNEGSPSDITQHPWQVTLTTILGQAYCGGALLNDLFAITARQCEPYIFSNNFVILGTDLDVSQVAIANQVHQIWRVGNYAAENFIDDIILLELTNKVTLSDAVHPICLPQPGSIYDNEMTLLSGFGATEAGGDVSTILNDIYMNVLPNADCESIFGNAAVTSKKICAQASGGPCPGDAGSPMIFELSPNQFELAGLASAVDNCNYPSYPHIFTRVTEYLDEIHETIAKGGNDLCEPDDKCVCGKLNGDGVRIVGGSEVDMYQFPWQIAFVLKGGIAPFCGGSIISPEYVMTAAHCVDWLVSEPELKFEVIAGEHNTKDGIYEYRATPVEVILHEDYNQTYSYNDIAVVKVKTPFRFNKNSPKSGKVCIARHDDPDFVGERATVTGWGLTSHAGDSSDVLLATEIDVLSDNFCESVYSEHFISTKLCAGDLAGGKDSCRGDSGGPLLLIDNTGHAKQIGIVSGGERCGEANTPAMYTELRHFYDWIQDKVGNEASIEGELYACFNNPV